jgi:pectate lyase
MITLAGRAALAPGALPVAAQATQDDQAVPAPALGSPARAADAEHVYTVTDRAELAGALTAGEPATPRIIRVLGTIDANTDDRGRPLSCEDYATDGYTLEGYVEAYDPATWGNEMPSGPMGDARRVDGTGDVARIVDARAGAGRL